VGGQMHKILFAGPVGAGKTTAIASVSDTPVVATDTRASDEVQARKQRTTVAMDYGTLKVDPKLTVQLLGTPGQVRFSFMWEILSQGAIGLILLIDHARPDPLGDLRYYIEAFRGLLDKPGAAAVLGVTRCDLSPAPGIDRYREALAEIGYRMPVFEVDARERDDVKVALLALAAELSPQIRRRQSA
jgi:signal recognition particle receptor subunit beta